MAVATKLTTAPCAPCIRRRPTPFTTLPSPSFCRAFTASSQSVNSTFGTRCAPSLFTAGAVTAAAAATTDYIASSCRPGATAGSQSRPLFAKECDDEDDDHFGPIALI